MLESNSKTRILANPHLRTSDGIPSEARFGERVPVPVTTFTPIAAGGVSQQPITSFNYENIGVNIEITPRIHHNDEISLVLRVEISSIFRDWIRRPPEIWESVDQHYYSPERRRNKHSCWLDTGRRARNIRGPTWPVTDPRAGTPLWANQNRNSRNRYRTDTDTAHHPCPRSAGRRSSTVSSEPRYRVLFGRSGDYPRAAAPITSGPGVPTTSNRADSARQSVHRPASLNTTADPSQRASLA